jgi:hypothetical protein
MTGADPSAERVVSVHRAALREALVGLGVSAVLLTGLLAGHPNWIVAGFYGGFALLTGTYTVLRTALKFRRRLSSAEPLPIECVEVPPGANDATRRRLLFALVVLAGIVALLVGFSDVRWVTEFAATLVAALISGQLVEPLSEAHLVARWERSHGRLFRPAGAEDDDDEEGARLYVAERPVPAA